MTLYAIDDVDDALDATRAFLWPFDLGRWARLALVAFFVGGAGGANPFQFGGGNPGEGGAGVPDAMPQLGGQELAVIAAVVSVVALLGFAFLFVGSVMEFVLVESLRREAVTIRRYWGQRWGQGLRLLAFRLLLGLLTLGVLGLLVAVVLAPVAFGDGGFSLGFFLFAVPTFVVVAVAGGLVNGFTNVFVVPIMVLEDCGLLAGWRRLWPTMTGRWKQYAAYAVMGFVLQLAGGILAGIVGLFAAVVLAVPLAVVGLVGAGLLSVLPAAGWAVIGLAALVFVLGLMAVFLFVSVPVVTFLRYYALFVLGDTNDAFDLVAERRRAVRA